MHTLRFSREIFWSIEKNDDLEVAPVRNVEYFIKEIPIMKLFRGDKLPHSVMAAEETARGRTFANHFCGNGLMAKFADDGSGQLLGGKDLLQLVLEHVGYDNGTSAQELSYHSPLLSFTDETDKAFVFCERNEKKRLRLKPCALDEATHFVWRLELELPRQTEAGCYDLVYRADPVNCLPFVNEQLQRGFHEEAVAGDSSKLLNGVDLYLSSYHAPS